MSAIDDNPFSKVFEGCIDDDVEIFSKKQIKGNNEL